MPAPHTPDDGPTTGYEFRERLVALVRAAHDNGIDIEGGWDDRNPDEGAPDWGIEIYEIAKFGPDRDAD